MWTFTSDRHIFISHPSVEYSSKISKTTVIKLIWLGSNFIIHPGKVTKYFGEQSLFNHSKHTFNQDLIKFKDD